MSFLRRLAFSSLSFGLISATAVQSQDFGFQVSNGLSLEQVVVTENANFSNGSSSQGSTNNERSTALIGQEGDLNRATSAIIDSVGSGTLLLQAGDSNQTAAIIQDSPGSAIAQVQIGNQNYSAAAIVGGSNNGIAVAQIGNNLGSAVALVNSQGTRVVYGQAGQGYSGGIVIKNAPVGTVVKLN